jgi:hypothetical protein
MSDSLFSLEPNEFVWRGPFDSAYGVHLVMLTTNEPGREAALEELEERVLEDARRARTREETEAAIKDVIEAYDVRVEYERESVDPSKLEDEGDDESAQAP